MGLDDAVIMTGGQCASALTAAVSAKTTGGESVVAGDTVERETDGVVVPSVVSLPERGSGEAIHGEVKRGEACRGFEASFSYARSSCMW